MDELFKLVSHQGGQGDYLSTAEALIAMGLSITCAMCIALTYRSTHKGTSYSQNYAQSLILMALVTTLIMIVIGSNIARAFSLVGALSIIRFRNAVKETRDVAFIFFVMAIAMACGTRFYTIATLATVLSCGIMVVLYVSNFGASRRSPERLLTVQLPPGVSPEVTLEPVLETLFQAYSLVSMESVRQGLLTETTYSVRPLQNIGGSDIIGAIARVNSNLKVIYNYAAHVDDL